MRVKFLTPSEEDSLVRQAHAGDVEARNRVVLGIWPLICQKSTRIAELYGGEPEELAHVGLAHCLEKFPLFDPSWRCRVSTYLIPAAWRAMQTFAQCNRTIRLPPRGGRSQRLERLRELAWQPLSLNDPAGDGADEEVGALIPGRGGDAGEDAVRAERLERLRACLRQLPWRLRLVLRCSAGGMKFADIGRVLRVSRETARKMQSRAVLALRVMMDGG